MPAPGRLELGEGAWVEVVPGFVADHEAAMEQLVATLPLRTQRLTIFGREVTTPRLVSWHGDPQCTYEYSRTRFEPLAWTAPLLELRERLRHQTGYAFNAVLANYYRDGQDAMGLHRDDERELGPHATDVGIASVSLGAMRRFVLRHDDGRRLEWLLGEGKLLVMGGTTQRHCRHQVPRTARPVGPRLNLTFRVLGRE